MHKRKERLKKFTLHTCVNHQNICSPKSVAQLVYLQTGPTKKQSAPTHFIHTKINTCSNNTWFQTTVTKPIVRLSCISQFLPINVSYQFKNFYNSSQANKNCKQIKEKNNQLTLSPVNTTVTHNYMTMCSPSFLTHQL